MKVVKILLIAILFVLAVLFIMLCVDGSLEAMPAVEQIEKGRIAYGIIATACVIAETALIISLVRRK